MNTLLELCADLPRERVAAGDVLIAEGSKPHHMVILVSGTVLVEREGTPFARIDVPGAVFGEMSWILDKPATATARASTDVVVHVVADPAGFFADRPEAALAVLEMTAGRLDGITQYLVDIKRQFTGDEVDTGLIDQILASLVHHQPPRPHRRPAVQPDQGHDPR